MWLIKGRYRILNLTWMAFFLSFVVWFNVAPFATTTQKDLNLTPEQIKVLAICNLALTIPARIAIGMVLDRFGPRITFSCLLGFAILPCFATAMAQNFDQLVWSSLATGIMGAGFVVGVRMVAEWFPPKEIGLAQGIYGGWGNFGAATWGDGGDERPQLLGNDSDGFRYAGIAGFIDLAFSPKTDSLLIHESGGSGLGGD